MKYLFLSMLVAISTSSFAQSWEVGVNGGVGHNSLPYVNGAQVHDSYFEWGGKYLGAGKKGTVPPFKSVFTFSIARNSKNNKWQSGVSLEMLHVSYSYTMQEDLCWQVNVALAKPALPVKLFLNRKFALYGTELYAGIAAGVVLFNSPAHQSLAYQEYSAGRTFGSGFTGGAHVGDTWFVTPRLGINAEVSYSYMALTAGKNNYSFFTSIASLGVHYRLAGNEHSKSSL